jgi:hypothetical protein
MTDYSAQIERINAARSLEEIQAIAREFSVEANGRGGILYSGRVGATSSEAVAVALAESTDQPIINSTPRAQFLSDASVTSAIRDSAERIFVASGSSIEAAEKSAVEFLYGNAKAPAGAPTSLGGSLWGEASREFAGSLRGNVTVVASAASPERVFGQIEIPAALNNPEVTSLGGQSTERLRTVYQQGGVQAVLPEVQSDFIEAQRRGIFVAPEQPGVRTPAVAVSREAAEALRLDPARFATAAELGTSGMTRMPAVATPGAAAPAALAAADDAALAAEAAARRGTVGGRLVGAAGIVGAAGMVYDIGTTANRVGALNEQGNTVAANSELLHFGARNLGALGGAGLGAGAGALAGVETGPGLLLTGAIGGIAGAIAGDRLAAYLDNRSIYNQEDRFGHSWRFDPEKPDQGWTRQAQLRTIDPSTSRETEVTQAFRAAGNLENELNFKASSRSVQLVLGNPPEPGNPYSIPSGPNERAGLSSGHWQRDADSGDWRRSNVLMYVPPAMIPISRSETASPERAAALDRESERIIARNAANTPAAIADRYQAAYEQYGWSAYGPVPEAVANARAQTSTLTASDGNTYQRQADGRWVDDGMIWDSTASGNTLRELNGTHTQLQAGLAQRPQFPPLTSADATPSMSLEESLAQMYARAGTPASPELIAAAAAAVRQDHQRQGIGPDHLLMTDSTTRGRGAENLGILTTRSDGRGGYNVLETTTPDEIRQQRRAAEPAPPQPNGARSDMPQPSPSQPAPSPTPQPSPNTSSPPAASETPQRQSSAEPVREGAALAIERLSPRDRENYDQALSLGQRLGLEPQLAQNFALYTAAQIKDNPLIQSPSRLTALQGRAADGGDLVFASYHRFGDKEPIHSVAIEVNTGARTPPENSVQRIEQRELALAANRDLGRDGPSRGTQQA